MCGVVGFVDKKRQLTSERQRSLIEAMVQTIDHRGRDDRGIYCHENVALGHLRLSILDLSPHAAQPFLDAGGLRVLSYNGEIYNFRSLNNSLQKKYHFRSTSDTETLLYSYIDQGVSCLNSLRGMYAFSLYDRVKDQVLLAVDPFGIKPLYYLDTPSWFAWCSEVKGLQVLLSHRLQLNTETLGEHFLFRQVVGSQTLFRDIRRVLPGHTIEYDIRNDSSRDTVYWDIAKKVEQRESVEDTLDGLLRTSVRSHLLADVPVGLQLSGGLDSSLVALYASREKSDLHTFSIGLADSKWNEFEYSRFVAKELNTQHHEILFSEHDFCEQLPLLTYHYDEPISHSHSIPMYLLALEAKKYVHVLLSGEGADELFMGYRRYLKLYEHFGKLGAHKILFSNAAIEHREATSVFSVPLSLRLEERSSLVQGNPNWSEVDVLSYYDIKTYLPPLLLRQDKMGMAATVENRVPFLDLDVAEFAFNLPVDQRIRPNDGKHIIKSIARRYFPEQFVSRDKCGFGQPLAQWLRNATGLGGYLEMFNEKNKERDFLNYPRIRELIQSHRSGRADHTELLWVLINFEIWMRIFIDAGTWDRNSFTSYYA